MDVGDLICEDLLLGDLLVAPVTVMHKMHFKMNYRLCDMKDIIILLNYCSELPAGQLLIITSILISIDISTRA